MTAHPAQDSFAPDIRSHRLAATLQIEAALREANTLEQVLFVAVNEFQRVAPYDTAVAWLDGAGKPKLAAATAVGEVDPASAFGEAVRALATSLVASGAADGTVELVRSDEPGAPWPPNLPSRALCSPLGAPDRRIGGLMLFRDGPWLAAEKVVVDHLALAAAFSAERFARRRRSIRKLATARNAVIAAAAIAAVSLLPVSQTALAPAEVVAVDPIVLAAPYGGVVKEILVAPNAEVKAGDALFRLDDTEIRGKHEIALRELEVARAELLAARQKAFGEMKAKTEAAVLERRIDLKRAEIDYYGELLARFTVTAPGPGVTIMGDPDEWVGRPVRVGEKVMTLAQTERTQLQVWLPVDDAIALAAGAPLRFFMNVDPLNPIEAALRQTAYEAEMSPNDVLSYRVRGAFSGRDADRPRLGLKGTARLTGERVTLFYYVLRRPLAVVRRTLGL